MKENKLRYFYDTLNSAVYPVQEIYENTMKNVPTTRFYEFLEAQNQEQNGMFNHGGKPFGYNYADENEEPPEPIKKSDISFSSQFSYEPIQNKEIKIKPVPKIIPKLCLDNLPEYETSSEEGEEPHQNQYNYQNNHWKNMQYGSNSIKDSNFDLSRSSNEGPLNLRTKNSVMNSKSNQRSSSLDFKMSSSF